MGANWGQIHNVIYAALSRHGIVKYFAPCALTHVKTAPAHKIPSVMFIFKKDGSRENSTQDLVHYTDSVNDTNTAAIHNYVAIIIIL